MKLRSGKITETYKNEYKNVEELIEDYYKNYPNKYYLNYPEFTINKLSLDEKLLYRRDTPWGLNLKKKRTREDIRNWMSNLNLTMNSWIYVGW